MLDLTRAYGLNFLYPLNDRTVGPALRAYGEFSRVEVAIAARYLALAPTGPMVDVGANIGAICLPLAALSRTRRVIAVEGHPGLAQVLGTNAFANGLFNVEVVQAVAGPEAGLTRFPAAPLVTRMNFGSLGVKDLGKGKTETAVRMCTLDEIVPSDTALIKIDVEGFEPEVLAGARETLENVRPVWIIETATNYMEQSRQTIATMLRHDYDVYWLWVPFVTRATAKGRYTDENFSGDVNIVAVPRGGPNPWNLKRVETAEDAFLTDYAEMSYLSRFGFVSPDWKTGD